MIYIVIGLGEFGRSAALHLQQLGCKVIGIDIATKEAELISELIEHVVIGDATDIHTLEEVNIAKSDGVLVSIGDNLAASLLCVVNLQRLQVKNVWVKAKSDAHHSILNSLGIVNIINPERDMGFQVAQKMKYPQIQEYIKLNDNSFLVKFSAFQLIIGKKFEDIFDNSVTVKLLMLIRGDEVIVIYQQDLIIEENDCLVCMVNIESLKLFEKLLKGK